jgi:hypothetical protein
MVISGAGDEVVLKAKNLIIPGIEFRFSNPETVTVPVLRVHASLLAGEPIMGQRCRISHNTHDSFAFFTYGSGELIRVSVKRRNTRVTASYSPGDASCK